MALPITIFKNILDFKCMHIEKAENETRMIHAYGEIWDQEIVAPARIPAGGLTPISSFCQPYHPWPRQRP